MRDALVLVVAIAVAGCGATPGPTASPEFTTLATSPETVRLSSWPIADPEAFAAKACAGTTWTVPTPGTGGACKAHIVDAVGDMVAAGAELLVICDHPDGTGDIFLGIRADPLPNAKKNCSGRLLRFVELP